MQLGARLFDEIQSGRDRARICGRLQWKAVFGGSKADLPEQKAGSQDLNLTSTIKERLHFRAICPPHPLLRKQRGEFI